VATISGRYQAEQWSEVASEIRDLPWRRYDQSSFEDFFLRRTMMITTHTMASTPATIRMVELEPVSAAAWASKKMLCIVYLPLSH
jgi:hypothetical protein